MEFDNSRILTPAQRWQERICPGWRSAVTHGARLQTKWDRVAEWQTLRRAHSRIAVFHCAKP